MSAIHSVSTHFADDKSCRTKYHLWATEIFLKNMDLFWFYQEFQQVAKGRFLLVVQLGVSKEKYEQVTSNIQKYGNLIGFGELWRSSHYRLL